MLSDRQLLPDPEHLGLPLKFSGWRPWQASAIVSAADCRRRAVVLNAPTGFGKTVAYMGCALLTGYRTAFLTASKGLQSQLLTDFQSCGLVDVRGQNNYKCRALLPGGQFYDSRYSGPTHCEAGPCHGGAKCDLRWAGCDYFDAVRVARDASLIVTNYSYWIAQHRYSEGLGQFDMLVLDEAHDVDKELAAALEIELTDYEMDTVLGLRMPKHEEPLRWIEWAQDALGTAMRQSERIEEDLRDRLFAPSAKIRENRLIKSLISKLKIVVDMSADWLVERAPHAARFAPIWPGPYAEKYLFLDIPKLVFVSATIGSKTMSLVGIDEKDFEFHEYPSFFPVSRRPVTHVPSVRVKYDWSDVDQKTWVRRIDQIIGERLDRKGIVHTTSYERRNLLVTRSEHRMAMLTHDSTNTRSIVERFREMEPPCILVSPSLSTGWDLPYEDCEYAIIGKVPFPDTRSLITKARTTGDEDYGPYLAMQIIVQASGRGMRSADDQCEVFVVDDQWLWFWKRYRKFSPKWFQAAVRPASLTIPDPLPKLKNKFR